jgi:hypothetical protein
MGMGCDRHQIGGDRQGFVAIEPIFLYMIEGSIRDRKKEKFVVSMCKARSFGRGMIFTCSQVFENGDRPYSIVLKVSACPDH